MNTGTAGRTVGRPEPDEIPSPWVGYVKRVPELDPVMACAAQIEETANLLRGLSDADATYRYDRGKWSIKEVVGHLCDIERIMAYRALRIARGDTTPLPGFDENAYVPVGKFDNRSLADLVGELRTSRAATLALLRTFDAEAWLRRGTANGKPVSVRALAYVIPGHERHHVEILRTRYRVGGVGGVC
ncbi:MAG TPA: DinB family protein [Gemmatimonadales bacterium]